MKCYCRCCQTLLDDSELKTIYDWVPYGDTNVPMASGQECPECGSDEIEDAYKCEICGEWFGESELYGSVCKTCAFTEITPELFFEFAEDWNETDGSILDDFFCLKYMHIETPKPDRNFHSGVVTLWNFVKDDIPQIDFSDYVLAYCKQEWIEFLKDKY